MKVGQLQRPIQVQTNTIPNEGWPTTKTNTNTKKYKSKWRLGNYSCEPSGLPHHSVHLHVIDGDWQTKHDHYADDEDLGHDHNHHADVDDLGHYHDYDVNGPDSAAFEATVLMLLTMTSAIW